VQKQKVADFQAQMALPRQLTHALANKDSGLLNQPKPQNQNPGPDKPGGNGSNGGDDNNSNFEPECIENSNPTNSYDYWHEPMHQSDSETIDTETESDWSEDSDWDEENFLKNLFVTASDGRIVELEKEQFRNKGFLWKFGT
jgi:hypothetical protein